MYFSHVCVHVMFSSPERGDFGETDRLDVDVSLSVEASSGVLHLDGVDLTQSSSVTQHCPVHCFICLTAIPHKMRQSHTLSDNQHSSQDSVCDCEI